MYELIINEKIIYTTSNKEDAKMKALFGFYRTNKQIFNIHMIAILNVEQQFYFEG